MNFCNKPRCINGSQASFICVDSKCFNSNPFICRSCLNYACKKLHHNCKNMEWGNFIHVIQNKDVINKKQYKQLCSGILDCIRDLQGMIKGVQIMQLYQQINNNKLINFNGNKINKILDIKKQEAQLEKSELSSLKDKLEFVIEKLTKLLRIQQKQSPMLFSFSQDLATYRNKSVSQFKIDNQQFKNYFTPQKYLQIIPENIQKMYLQGYLSENNITCQVSIKDQNK